MIPEPSYVAMWAHPQAAYVCEADVRHQFSKSDRPDRCTVLAFAIHDDGSMDTDDTECGGTLSPVAVDVVDLLNTCLVETRIGKKLREIA